MTKTRKRGSSCQLGFTIVEVLIASTVFVIAFTVMVTLLDKTINRFSTRDMAAGTNTAQELMLTSIATQDTTSSEIVIMHGNVTYSVNKMTLVNDGLAQVTIEVKREKTKKKIISLYNEFPITQKP